MAATSINFARFILNSHSLPDLRKFAHRVAYLPDGNVSAFFDGDRKNSSLKRFNGVFWRKFIPQEAMWAIPQLRIRLSPLDAVWRAFIYADKAKSFWRLYAFAPQTAEGRAVYPWTSRAKSRISGSFSGSRRA